MKRKSDSEAVEMPMKKPRVEDSAEINLIVDEIDMAGVETQSSIDKFDRSIADEKGDDYFYATHFKSIISSVSSNPLYQNIFDEYDKHIFHIFLNALSNVTVSLFARLCNRKGPWFKSGQLLEKYR
jgi:hypothetical protein